MDFLRIDLFNIMVSYEIKHFLKSKKKGFMTLKLEWHYTRVILARMGFDGRWINLVMHYVSSVSYTFTHAGKEMGPLLSFRGIRQDDPKFRICLLFIFFAKCICLLFLLMVS